MASKELIDGLTHLGFGSLLGAAWTSTQLETAVFYAQLALGLSPTGTADDALLAALRAAVRCDAEPPPEGMVVRGYVRGSDGAAIRDQRVEAFDRDLRHMQPLGVAATDARGHYEISYDAAMFRRSEKGRADLVVRCAGEKSTALGSATLFDAPAVAIVCLVTAPLRRLTEWTISNRAIDSVLDGADPAELTEDDLAFLIREVPRPREQIDAWGRAYRLAGALRVDPSAVYACLRQGISSDRTAFLSQPRGVLQSAVDGAVERERIPALDAAAVTRFLDTVARALVTHHLDTSTDSPVAGVLAVVLPDSETRAAFVQLVVSTDPDATSDEFWRSVEANPSLSASVPRLKNVLELANLTGANAPLIQAMHNERIIAQWGKTAPLTVLDLASAPRSQLRQLIVDAGIPAWLPAGTDAERTNLYVTAMDRVLEVVATTPRIAARLAERAGDNLAGDVAAFMKANPALDLLTEPVDKYIARTQATIADGPRAHLRAIQRLAKITPRFDEIQALLDTNVTSALRIATTPPQQFALQSLPGVALPRALALHENATRRTLLGSWIQQHAGEPQGPAAIPPPWISPDMESLFGSQDYCACDECGAADGPAAYFVDLMHLLKGQSSTTTQTAFDILTARRPDLSTLPLTCYNTLTPLPYIDIVNERLEARVSKGAAPTAPGPSATELSAAALRLEPQYVYETVYDDLAKRTFPWTLPFELGSEKIRAALREMGTSRSELLAAFRPVPSETTADADRAEAYEYFQIPQAEAALFTATSSLEAIFGSGATVDLLANAKVFLERTGIDAADLFTLVEKTAIGQGARMAPADECDTSKLTITPADEPLLRRLGLFLRLRRRVGLPILDLDALLTGLGRAVTDADAIVDVWRVLLWRDRYGSSLDDALSWTQSTVSPNRDTSLARALKVDPSDLAPLETLLGAPKATTGSVTVFLRSAARFASTGLSLSEVRWLLSGQEPPPNTAFALTETQVGAALHSICVELANLPNRARVDGAVAGFDDAQEKDVAVQVIARTLRLELEVTNVLLDVSLSLGPTDTATLAKWLDTVASVLPTDDVTVANAASAFAAFRVVERVAFVVNRLALSDAETLAIISAPVGSSWLAIGHFVTADVPGSLEALFNVAECATLRRSLGREGSIVELIGADPLAAATSLATGQGWGVVDAFASLLAPGASFTASFGARLAAAAGLLLRSNLAFSDVAPALTPIPSPADGKTLLAAVKSRMTTLEWSDKGQHINDRLRVARRDALLASLNATSGATPESLMGELLLDVEISDCQLTSRVKSAIGSVQLFIHRCLMNLEHEADPTKPSLALPEEVSAWWRWMQNYRVWQANRKVFLYPENWIEPELRDDKTPLFTNLESALSQQDVTADAADEAFQTYLQELEDIGRLEIMGVHREEPDGGAPVIHLVGRRWAEPRTYYYRQRIGASQWTPWEALDADIEGDNVMLTVNNGRPTIVWAVIREERDPDGIVLQGKEPPKRWGLRFSWVERTHGKWGGKRSLAPSEVVPAMKSSVPSVDEFMFRASSVDGALTVSFQHKFAGPFSPDNPDTKDLLGNISVVARYGALVSATGIAGVFAGEAIWYEYGDVALGSCRKGGLATVPRLDVLNAWRPARFASENATIIQDATRQIQGVLPLSVSIVEGEPLKIFAPKASQTPAPAFQIVADLDDDQDFFALRPFVFQSERDTFLVEQVAASSAGILGSALRPDLAANNVVQNMITAAGGSVPAVEDQTPKSAAPPYFRLSTLEHFHACELLTKSERVSLADLLSLKTQQNGDLAKPADTFSEHYGPKRVAKPYPVEDIDFSRGGSYSPYNWEVFFHAPYLSAVRLMQNRRYEEALSRLQVIFDPTAGGTASNEGVERYWRFLPFHEIGKPGSVGDLLAVLGDDSASKDQLAAVLEQLDAYRTNPFNPHLIARLRPSAYMRSVVMRYLDCLIGWGDQLFGEETSSPSTRPHFSMP